MMLGIFLGKETEKKTMGLTIGGIYDIKMKRELFYTTDDDGCIRFVTNYLGRFGKVEE